MSHLSLSAARSLPALALAFLLSPGRALAAPAGAYDPPLDPRIALDPRTELDFRLDRDDETPRKRAVDPDPAKGSGEPRSRLRVPVWFSIGATYRQLPAGEPSFGAMLLVGLPLERLSARGVRAGIGEDAHPSPSPSSTAAGDAPGGRRKLDLTPPPPPPKLPIPASMVLDAPLRLPVVVTPSAAKAAVEAALRRAKLADPDARLDAIAARARQSAGLPELRLRVMRTVDDGQTLSPVSYDPTRIVAVDAVRFWLEARATWKLDRLLFAEEEVSLERMRHERAEAQAKLTKEVLKLLFDWQRARANADNATLPPEENLAARLKAIEAEAELDLLTDGWFARWRASLP